MCLKVKTNVKQLHAEASKIDAYGGIGITETQIALIILANIGMAITNNVLCVIDGKDLKTVDKNMLVNLTNIIKQGAEHPLTSNILEQLVAVLTYNFDMHLKVKANVKWLRVEATNGITYGGIGVSEPQISLVIIANMDVASKEPYKWEFCHATCNIHQ